MSLNRQVNQSSWRQFKLKRFISLWTFCIKFQFSWFQMKSWKSPNIFEWSFHFLKLWFIIIVYIYRGEKKVSDKMTGGYGFIKLLSLIQVYKYRVTIEDWIQYTHCSNMAMLLASNYSLVWHKGTNIRYTVRIKLTKRK